MECSYRDRAIINEEKAWEVPIARVTDTGLDLQEAAKRLKIDWDTAAEIDDAELSDESEVPPVLAGFLGFLVIK
ncbi:hypothetical protein GBA52_013283 [Prunus armeniaca]|nr:hypothetical protein GBA52_013283 [Prunus armeniaca]